MEMRCVTCPRTYGTDVTVKLKRRWLHRNLKSVKTDGCDVINAELPATKKNQNRAKFMRQ